MTRQEKEKMESFRIRIEERRKVFKTMNLEEMLTAKKEQNSIRINPFAIVSTQSTA